MQILNKWDYSIIDNFLKVAENPDPFTPALMQRYRYTQQVIGSRNRYALACRLRRIRTMIFDQRLVALEHGDQLVGAGTFGKQERESARRLAGRDMLIKASVSERLALSDPFAYRAALVNHEIRHSKILLSHRLIMEHFRAIKGKGKLP